MATCNTSAKIWQGINGPGEVSANPSGEAGVEYRRITGYCKYLIGSDGSVWGTVARGPRCGSMVKMRPAPDDRGRLATVLVRDDGKNVTWKVHSLVLCAFAGPPSIGLEACHENDVCTDNRASNLRWDTEKSNAGDKKKNGLDNTGSRHGSTHMTEGDAFEIMRLAMSGVRSVDIAEMFSIAPNTVGSLLARNAFWATGN
jgi:hypothetical protein